MHGHAIGSHVRKCIFHMRTPWVFRIDRGLHSLAQLQNAPVVTDAFHHFQAMSPLTVHPGISGQIHHGTTFQTPLLLTRHNIHFFFPHFIRQGQARHVLVFGHPPRCQHHHVVPLSIQQPVVTVVQAVYAVVSHPCSARSWLSCAIRNFRFIW